MYDINIDDPRFEWDEVKNRANIRKHGVSFNEARSVFFDDNAVRFFDPEHSANEDRFILIGLSTKTVELVVCHCYRGQEEVFRIFSARRAEKPESENYWRRRHESSL